MPLNSNVLWWYNKHAHWEYLMIMKYRFLSLHKKKKKKTPPAQDFIKKIQAFWVEPDSASHSEHGEFNQIYHPEISHNFVAEQINALLYYLFIFILVSFWEVSFTERELNPKRTCLNSHHKLDHSWPSRNYLLRSGTFRHKQQVCFRSNKEKTNYATLSYWLSGFSPFFFVYFLSFQVFILSWWAAAVFSSLIRW